MNHSEFELEQAKWRDLVGGFILAFGDVEVITHRLWRDYCNGKAPLFKPRVEALLKAFGKLEPKTMRSLLAWKQHIVWPTGEIQSPTTQCKPKFFNMGALENCLLKWRSLQ